MPWGPRVSGTTARAVTARAVTARAVTALDLSPPIPAYHGVVLNPVVKASPVKIKNKIVATC